MYDKDTLDRSRPRTSSRYAFKGRRHSKESRQVKWTVYWMGKNLVCLLWLKGALCRLYRQLWQKLCRIEIHNLCLDMYIGGWTALEIPSHRRKSHPCLTKYSVKKVHNVNWTVSHHDLGTMIVPRSTRFIITHLVWQKHRKQTLLI